MKVLTRDQWPHPWAVLRLCRVPRSRSRSLPQRCPGSDGRWGPRILDAILNEILGPDLLKAAVGVALRSIVGTSEDDGRRTQVDNLSRDISRLEGERQRLVEAIASGGELWLGLLEGLKAREGRLASLRADCAQLRAATKQTVAVDIVRQQLRELAEDWRHTLAGESLHARPLLAKLLVGRVRFTPRVDREWLLRGQGTLLGLFERVLPASVALGSTSPAGFEPALPA